MIHWLMQSAQAHPDLARGVPPAGLLSALERARFEQLVTPKRKRDWLCGRWTAKLLLQKLYREEAGHTIPLDSFSITNNADGVPLVTGHWSLGTNYSLSLSHSHDHAFCAVIERSYSRIGVDMERIVSRGDGFVEDYFTTTEQALFRAAQNAEFGRRNICINGTWSAKEAVLKALHLGLSVDTRAIQCLLEPFIEPPTRWTSFTIRCDDSRLPRPAPTLAGWWQVQGEFVLTVVVGEKEK